MARRTPKKPRPRRCFLSHADKDVNFAEVLAEVLAAHGIDVFFSAAQYLGVGTWMDQIGKELDRCEWFLVVVSPAAAKSLWVKHELQYALSEERYRDRLIPIQYEELDITQVTRQLAWPLRNFDILNFTDFEAGCRDLLEILGVDYSGRS